MFKIVIISLFSFIIGFFSRDIIKKKKPKKSKSIPLSKRKNFGEAMEELKIK